LIMKKYVVGILSLFDNELEQFKIAANNEYDAVKQAMLEFCKSDGERMGELEYQSLPDYPLDLEALHNAYEETAFNVIEI